MVRPYNKDSFENEITNNLDKILIVSKNPSNEGNEQAIVMYYSFKLEGKEANVDPKEKKEVIVNPKEEKKMYDKKKRENRKSNNVEKDGNVVKSVAKKNTICMAKESENKSNEEESKVEESEEDNNRNVELIEGEDKEELVEDEIDEIEEESNEFLIFAEFKSDITLTSNKLKATKLYKEFLLLEKGLPVVALFFDDNVQVHKSDYYNNKESSTSKIIQFDSSLINGALIHKPTKQKKKILVTLDEITINIPGFCGKVSACKLKIFTTAGPRLVELLKALNNNWVILDLVDYTTITWLANIKKDEWIELIHQITSNL
ncbi:45088_t:CDS:2 [Gigaspora margarita]|uniref:45088_t:CDS:1 n=1 Tax=Gigaspora margarita TaxID=4874 RepID=A0ABN7UFS3_GIGMA|nr:45088_t:CDS:2 [Gigaspora margarita]